MPFVVGHTRRGRETRLTTEERSRHLHVLGASGTGKSKLLEHLIRQDILAGRGLCLVDPHGTLADAIIEFCATRCVLNARRVHVMEPASPDWCVGFNPLRLDGATEPEARVDAMVAACAQVWGGETMANTPLLKKVLRSVFYALATRELTLLEAVELITATDSNRSRQVLTSDLPNAVFRAIWTDFNALTRREFSEQFSSTNNRLIEFLSSPVVRRVVGQKKHVLDLKQIMDGREILIVNLAPRGSLSADNARLLGTLLTSELFLLALARDPTTAKQCPFTLYIDECYDYLTSDIERMLDQTRKFGLHLVLAHQRLGQLRDRSMSIYNGVMAGGQTKIVFGGLEDDDAEVMARQIMRDSFKLERPKRTLNKPIVVDEVPYWLESQSETESETSSRGTNASEGWSHSVGTSDGQSVGYRYLSAGLSERTGHTDSAGTSSGYGDSGGFSTSEGTSSGLGRTRGRAQTLKPVRVILPTAVHSLEEELHLAIVKLRELPNRAAVLKRRGRTAVQIRIPEVRSCLAGAGLIEGFERDAHAASPYVSSVVAADEEIAGRHAALHRTVTPRADGDGEFWHSPGDPD